MSVLIRVSSQTHESLKSIADARDLPIGAVVAEAVKRLEDDKYWADVDAAYARLRANPKEWADYTAEIAEWDVAMQDGLENEEPYYRPGEA